LSTDMTILAIKHFISFYYIFLRALARPPNISLNL